MSELNIKVRMGGNFLYDLKVIIDLKMTVSTLKDKICAICNKQNKYMDKEFMIIMYCGLAMMDNICLNTYNLFSGVTIHVYQQIKPEMNVIPDKLDHGIVLSLAKAFRSLLLNSTYRASFLRLSKLETLNMFLFNHPNMISDPIAVTLFQHPELLMKMTDCKLIKRFTEQHPALAALIINIGVPAHKETLQNYVSGELMSRSALSNGSDDDDDDLDDSSASEVNGQSFPRNLVSGEITAAQLASAIASATSQQPQPSTSGASTSTGSMTSVIDFNNSALSQPSTSELILPTQLQIMRDIGLTNDAVNIAALQLSNDLETAIELVLNGLAN